MPIATWPAAMYYEFGFNAPAGQGSIPPFWTNLSARVLWAWKTQRGRYYELDTNPTGMWNFALQNADGALDPDNTASPYAGNLVPYRCCRIRSLTGVNQLTVDQATAGQAGAFLGTIPPRLHVVNDQGYALSIAASGSAYQGSQVYQATLTTGATTGASILLVQQAPVIPGNWYSFQAQARITSGNSVATNATVTWWDQNGNSLGTAAGGSVALTSGSATWVQIPVSGQAPNTCYSATLKVEIASGALAASTTWQIDGLQWENSATVTPWQAPQSLSANLLPQAIATGTASISPVNDSAANWFFPMTGSVAQVSFLTAAPSGQSTSLAWTTPSGTTASSPLYAGVATSGVAANGAVADCVQVASGTQFTASVYLMRAASADATVQVATAVRWYDAAGAVISSSAGSAVTVTTSGWVRASVTATSPSNASWGRPRIQITSPASTTATNTVYATGWQFEAAGSASIWTDPGPTYQIFNGSVERWPQSWELSGTYGKVNAVGVDNFALLSQDIIPSPFVAEVLAMGPNFLFQLNDPVDSPSCVDSAGNRSAAPVENSPFGIGSLTFGNSITSTDPTGTFVGTSGPIATFNNNASDIAPNQFPETFVNIAKTTTSPGPPVGASWTRLISFRSTTAPVAGQQYFLWMSTPGTWNSAANPSFFYVVINSGGGAIIGLNSASNVGFQYTGTTNLCDGNWHQIAVVFNLSTLVHGFYIDGARVSSPTANIGPSGCTADALGCNVSYGQNWFMQGFIGDLAHAVELPIALSATQVANLYTSWRAASAGDSTGQRTQRVLTWAGYSGPTAIENGATTNMGPATDVAGSTAIDTSTALLPGGIAFTGGSGVQALNTIAQSENGNVYCANNGPITFAARTGRYNKLYPKFIFGEHDYAGEWPYELVTTDFDPSHLYTGIQATQYATGQVASARSTSAAFNFGQRVNQLTMNQALFSETQDAANYLLGRYETARTRIPAVRLHPSAMPGLFAVCLQLEIGTRIRVMRRPPNAPARQYDLFIESVAWSVDPTTGKAIVTLQCSPADLTAYWTLASLHTALASQAASGQAQATINALPDAAVNALSASLSQNTGYQLVFDPGTAIQETMTLATGGVPATSVGYTSATLTFTSNFAHTHAAGAIVCEVLPTGYTDPTTWDIASVLAALSTTVNTAATSGTNTITVNALPDAKVNPAGSNWTAGDLIWIGVGTPNFEGYNLLTPNQSTAGEGVIPLAAGTSGNSVGVMSAIAAFAVTASATAWQGANVWQNTVGSGATNGFRLLRILLPATPGQVYTASFYVRSVTSGANPSAAAQLLFANSQFTTLASTSGTSATLTGSASATWTRVTVTATAPAGSAWLQAGIPLTATGPGLSWNFQADGLQVEANATASTYQTCPQIQSVAASVAGYSTVTLTLAQNLANNHSAGETVCDPLPGGTTSPSNVAGTTRITY